MAIAAARKLIPGRAIGRLAREPLWDTENAIASTNYASLTFFSKPQGQAMNDGTIKSITHTNLTQAAMLGEPNQFVCMGFRVRARITATDTKPETAMAIRNQIRQQGVLQFGLSGKIFYEIPLNEVPQGLGFDGFYTQTAAADLDIISYGRPEANVYYTLRIPGRVQGIFKAAAADYAGYELIDSTTPITCKLNFDPVLACAGSEQVDIQVQLVGIRLKTIG
jgi:hypothetical protein